MKKKLKKLLEIDRQIKEHEKFIQNIDDFPYYKVFGDHGKADDLKAAKDELKFLHFEARKILVEISEILNIKIKNEIERIDFEIKQKACDEVFKALNQIFRPMLSKKEDACQNQSLEKAISYCIENFSAKEATKRIVDYIKSDRELSERFRKY